MLKNWTVTTKQIKKQSDGFQNHINYLVDKNRSSHANTRFVVLNNAAKNIVEEINNRKEHRQEVGLRGGGVSNYATSFCLNLPRDIKQPTDEEWAKIANIVIERLAKINELDPEKLKSLTHLVIHDESKGNKNNHLNMAVSNVYGNSVVKGITQLRSTHGVKMAFNDAVRDVLGVDNYSYQPINAGLPSEPLWAARERKAKETEDRALKARQVVSREALKFKALKESVNRFKESFKEWINKVKNKEPAQPQAIESADILDEIDWETPNDVLEIEKNNEVPEIDKISNKRENDPEKPKSSRKRRRRE